MKLLICIGIIVVVLLLLQRKLENFEPYVPTNADNWIRLYETFTFRPNPPDARWWEYTSTGPGYIKKDLKMRLKSYDIKVKHGRVQIWAVNPGDPVASTSALGVSGYDNAYTDAMPLFTSTDPSKIAISPGWQHTYTTDSFKANSAKYKLIADARDGDHIKGTLDFTATRIMVIASLF